MLRTKYVITRESSCSWEHGESFKRHRATIQGLLYLLPRDGWSVEFVGAELAAAILEK